MTSMGIRGLAAVVALAAAAGAGAWLLLSGGGPPPSGSGPEAGGPPATGAGTPGAPAPDGTPVTSGAGRIGGLLLRDGRPHPGVVTAWLVDRGPPDPGSWSSWDSWWDRGSPLFTGLEASPRASATAGADGTWSMAGLAPGVYHFLASADGGLRGRGTEDVAPSGAALALKDGTPRDPLRIDLEPAPCTIRGRILLEGGAPWKGFGAVRTGVYAGGDPLPVAVDAEGRFAVADLPPGRVRLSALEPGVREVPGPFVLLPCPVEVVFTAGGGAAAIPCRIVEDATGAPVPGAAVRAEYQDSDEGECGGEEAVTDAEGRLLLRPPGKGSGWSGSLHAEAKGFRPGRIGRFEIPPADAAGLLVRLRRPASLAGRVVAAGTGAPVAGARVVHGDADGEREAETLSGPDGRYEMPDLEPGPGTLRATGDGWISRSLTLPGVRYDEVLLVEGVPLERDIVVAPSPRLRGRVLDAEGRPAAGVRVRLEPEFRDGVPGELDNVATDLRGDVETAADGTFRIPCMAPWVECTVVASVGKIALARQGPLVLEPGEEQAIEIRLPPERFLDVRVLAGEGGPSAEGANVEVSAAGPHSWSRDTVASGTLPPEGTLRVGPLPADPFLVRADAAAGGASGEAEVAAGVAGSVVIVLEGGDAGGRTVEGRVLLPDGTPAVGASVEITMFDEDGETAWNRSGENADVRGAFRFEGVPPGPARVDAYLQRDDRNHSGTAEVPEAGGEVEVALRPGAPADREPEARHRFTVRVTGPDGAPVARAEASIRGFDGEDWQHEGVTLVAGEGTADFRSAEPPGAVHVEIHHASAASGTPLPLAHGIFGPFDGKAGSADIRLPPAAAIEGRVLSPAGEGVESLKVYAEPVYAGIDGSEDWSPPDVAEAVTGPGGKFRLDRLGSGAYRLRSSAWPVFAPTIPVEARGGATGIDLRLRPAVAVTIRVLDGDGRPVEGARVDANARGNASGGEAATGAAGTVRLHGLDPEGEYDLNIRPPEGREDLLRFYQKGWRPADGEFRMARAHVLEVLVQDPSGKPIPGASVWAQREGNRNWSHETTNDGGVAAFERLAAGRVLLRARLSEDLRTDSPGVEAAAAASSGRVVVVLDPGLEIRIRVVREGKARSVTAWLAEPGEAEPSRRVESTDGEIRIRGMREGAACTVYLREERTGRYALLRGVAAGGEPREAALAEGKTIRVHATLPEDGRIDDAAILVDGAELILPETWEDDGVVFSGVPPGRWTVRIRARLPGVKEPVAREASVEAGAADPVEFDFPR